MNWQNLIIQLGVSGLIVYGGIRIALLLIDRWSVAEAARTKAITEGFTGLGGKVDLHHTADIESHRELGEGIAEIRGKLDEARWYRDEFTPVGPPPAPPRRTATPARGVRSPRPGTHHDEDR